MPGNPNISQGVLNRLLGSVLWTNFGTLNVTAPYLGKRGIRIAFGGGATTFVNTLTGRVASPEPYVEVTLTMHLLKTQALAGLYKSQIELSALLGPCTVYPDAAGFPVYPFTNMSLETVQEVSYAGDDPVWAVTAGGQYNINNNLWP